MKKDTAIARTVDLPQQSRATHKNVKKLKVYLSKKDNSK